MYLSQTFYFDLCYDSNNLRENSVRRILPYLVLNMIVSAVTVLLVLVIWQQTHKEPARQAPQQAAEKPVAAQPASTLPPLDEDTVEIQMVVGAGDIEYERVQLVSASENPVEMTGWQLSDGRGNVYTFPSFKLYPGGSVNLFTAAGADTSIELYWNRAEAIWESGRTVELADSDGNRRAKYRIP